MTISEVRRETSGAVSLLFEVPESLKAPFAFEAGQYVNVRTILDGEEVRRSYSICSTPDSGELRIAVKRVPGGKFSCYANDVLATGDTIEVMPPQGRFTLPPQDESTAPTYIFFAAGSGITPVISLIATALDREPECRVILFYGNRTADQIIFRDALDALKNRYMDRFGLFHVLSREKQSAPLFNGRIDTDKCSAWSRYLFRFSDVRRFFLCGPGEMTFIIRDWLKAQGVEDGRIAIELFTTPGSGQKQVSSAIEEPDGHDPAKECLVTVRLDGDTTEFRLQYGGMSILDAAAAEGLDVPFSCKGGVCCTCKAMLLEGEVSMDVVYGLEPDEIEDGYILTCQSHPRTETVLVDYDLR